LVATVGSYAQYGVAAGQPANTLELVLGVGSDGNFGAWAAFWGALYAKEWSGTAAIFGLGPKLPIDHSGVTSRVTLPKGGGALGVDILAGLRRRCSACTAGGDPFRRFIRTRPFI
jgi:hypothetical protein